jgi:hypothetical protein
MKQYYRLFGEIHPVVEYRVNIGINITVKHKIFISFVNRSSMFLSCVFEVMNINA